MPITRTFLDWSRPLLGQAAEYLVARFSEPGRLELSRVVVATPASRPGRTLLNLLLQRARQEEWIFTPPQMLTVGALPECLYTSQRPLASDLVQQLTWVAALQDARPADLSAFAPKWPENNDVLQWLSLGRLLWRQHRELASDGLDFSHVCASNVKVDDFQEAIRWRALAKVQAAYLQKLDALELWDTQTARLFAIEHRECRTEKEIVLVGAADMNRATRLMLDQVADRVATLITAPAERADFFDQHGCLAPAAWKNVLIDIPLERVRVVDTAADQAEEAVRIVAGFDGRFRADQIVIGAPDESLAPRIQRCLSDCGVASRWVIGQTLQDTGPYRFLQAAADYANRRRFSEFAALARHPDVYDWLLQNTGGAHWLGELDAYHGEHLPPRLGHWLGDNKRFSQLKKAFEKVDTLLKPLRSNTRKLNEWAKPLQEMLAEVYGALQLDQQSADGHYLAKTLRAIRDALAEHAAVSPTVSPAISAADAIRLLLESLSGKTLAPLPSEDALEVLGWLELPLDDAPALVVTSFNEGRVPTSLNSDIFLPNRLRRKLGIEDNDRRYARDAYATSLLLAARQEVYFIVGRRDTEGNPLIPSRLLFAAPEDQIAQRVRHCFQAQDAVQQRRLKSNAPQAGAESRFYVPRPKPLEQPIESLSVTEFGGYLACPYRYYLRRCLKLQTSDDSAEELGAADFGNLLHDVLARFGLSEQRDLQNAEAIFQFLQDALRRAVAAQYGKQHLPAVNVQLAHLRRRLEAFAHWQAEHARQGWRIIHTETSSQDAPTRLKLKDRSILLRGRIDRIDRNEASGQWRILDYKTSDAAKTPEQTHRRAGAWIDLQLPLYQLLARSLGVTGEIELGYILLPKDIARVGEAMAAWDDELIAAAHDVARCAAEDILDEKFWPPTDPPPPTMTEFSDICQDDAFERGVLEYE